MLAVNDFKKLTISEIDSFKAIVEKKLIDCKKDLISAIKEAISSSNEYILPYEPKCIK